MADKCFLGYKVKGNDSAPRHGVNAILVNAENEAEARERAQLAVAGVKPTPPRMSWFDFVELIASAADLSGFSGSGDGASIQFAGKGHLMGFRNLTSRGGNRSPAHVFAGSGAGTYLLAKGGEISDGVGAIIALKSSALGKEVSGDWQTVRKLSDSDAALELDGNPVKAVQVEGVIVGTQQ